MDRIVAVAKKVTRDLQNERYINYDECIQDVRRVINSYIGKPEKFTIPEINARLDALQHLRGKDRCTL